MQTSPPNGRRRPQPAPDPPPARFAAASLLLLGLILGLAGGLTYAWIINPVVFVDASPARLDPAYKETYIFLVSQSYAASGDAALAQRRLQALDDPALPQTVDALLATYLRQEKPPQVIENLAALAQMLGAEGTAVSLFAPTPLPGALPTPTPIVTPDIPPSPSPTLTPSPTATPSPSPTPAPTQTPTPTPQPDYRLLNQERVCLAEPAPRIEVVTFDALLNELAGIEVQVTWQGGGDTFFTGFKPAEGAGYGDFTMAPETSYSVVLAAGSPEVSGLRIEPCSSGLDGGWRLSFQNVRLVLTPTPEVTP